jgi:hypothetical protein
MKFSSNAKALTFAAITIGVASPAVVAENIQGSTPNNVQQVEYAGYTSAVSSQQNNIEFVHAVLNNRDGAAMQFRADPEPLMEKYNLSERAKTKLREIGNAWSNGQTELVQQGWDEYTDEFVAPELAASMRW